MKRRRLFTLLFLAVFAASAGNVSAHEHNLFKIGDKQYWFELGMRNEPVYVDDKTGLELRVMLADPKDLNNPEARGMKPVLGLDKSLKLEVSDGSTAKAFDLKAAYGEAGLYQSTFYPTRAAPLQFKLSGTIDGAAVDLSFDCVGSDQAAPDDKTINELGRGVTRLQKYGSFGCPLIKTDAQFPEKTLTQQELTANQLAFASQGEKTQSPLPYVGLALSSLAFILVIIVLIRSLKRPQM